MHIRSLLAHGAWDAAARAGRDAIEIAVQNVGDIRGHGVTLGLPGHSMCSPADGNVAAQTVVTDERVAGLIARTCSGAAGASALFSAAGSFRPFIGASESLRDKVVETRILSNADGLFTSDFLGSEVSRDSHFAESIVAFGRCNGLIGESET